MRRNSTRTKEVGQAKRIEWYSRVDMENSKNDTEKLRRV